LPPPNVYFLARHPRLLVLTTLAITPRFWPLYLVSSSYRRYVSGRAREFCEWFLTASPDRVADEYARWQETRA
jgi:hypothetical protein